MGQRLMANRGRIFVALGVVAGLWLRIWLIRTNMGQVDYDESIAGLMARNAQHGHFAMYFWGQYYGGSQEPTMVALVFAIFGRSAAALKVVPIALHGAAALVLWRVGARLMDRKRGILAGLLLWCFPASFVWWSTKERGFYELTMVLGLLAILLCLRLAEDPRRGDFIALGLVAGLGIWVSPQTSFLALPAVLWLVAYRRGILAKAWPVVPAALVAAIPWLVWNVLNNWRALTLPRNDAIETPYVHRLTDFLHRVPLMFGMVEPFSGRQLVPGPAWVRELIGVALLAAGAWWARNRLYEGPASTGDPAQYRRVPGLLWWLLAMAPLLYATNALVNPLQPHPRYMFLFLPVVVLALAAISGAAAMRGAVLALAVAVSIWGLGVMHGFAGETAGHNDLAAGPINDLIAYLDQEHITRVITDHVGPQITFATDERIIGSNYTNERQLEYAELTQRQRVPDYVFVTALGNQYNLYTRMRHRHITYKKTVIGPWTVIEPSRRVLPQ